jgi:hypothetical protein
MALGVNITFSRLASVVNGLVTPGITKDYGIGSAFLFGAILCFFSLFNAVGLAIVDRFAEKKTR